MAAVKAATDSRQMEINDCTCTSNKIIDLLGDFEFVSKLPQFIDKTLLIKEIFRQKYRHILITAPLGFGKSTNLDMVQRFSEMKINKKTGKIGFERDSMNFNLFKSGRLISEEHDIIKEYFAKFATIRISFTNVYGKTMESLMIKYAEALAETFKNHKYLLKSEEITVEDKNTFSKYISAPLCNQLSKYDLGIGITFLVRMLSKHCNNFKVFAFVDSYDSPLLNLIRDKHVTDEHVVEVLKFFRNIFGSLLQKNGDIHRVLITGESTLGAVLFPSEPIVKICKFMSDHPFGNFYGLSPEEFKKFVSCVAKPPRNQIISDYGYVTLQNKIVLSFRTGIHLQTNIQSDPSQEFFVNAKLKLTLKISLIRYILLKATMDSGFPTVIRTFTSVHNVIRKLQQIGIKYPFISVNDIDVIDAYINLLLERGFCHIEKLAYGNTTIVKLANDSLKTTLLEVVEKGSEKLCKLLKPATMHLNDLSISSGEEYFLKFAKLLKSIFQMIKLNERIKSDVERTIIEIFLDILSTSKYHINLNLCLTPVGQTLCFDDALTGVNCHIKYNLKAEDALLVASKNLLFGEYPGLENKIYLGINVDENMSASFGVIINNQSIKRAIYYNI